MTRRLVRACENPHVHVIGHPTARSIGRRPPVDADWDEVFRAAARTGTAMEIDSFPDRLDLPADLIRRAKRLGVKFSIDTDAHSLGHHRNIRYGVGTAQRGWLTPTTSSTPGRWSGCASSCGSADVRWYRNPGQAAAAPGPGGDGRRLLGGDGPAVAEREEEAERRDPHQDRAEHVQEHEPLGNPERVLDVADGALGEDDPGQLEGAAAGGAQVAAAAAPDRYRAMMTAAVSAMVAHASSPWMRATSVMLKP